MKKTLLLIIMYTLIQLNINAQVVLSLQLPPSGVNVKSQLWNFSMINTSLSSIDVRVEIIITEFGSNQRVMTATSRSFQLQKGAKQVQYNDVMPVIYNVNAANYGIDNSPEGFLPVGIFSVCYNVHELVNDGSEQVASECETIEIEPVSPPMLIMPADSERVDVAQPFFTWIPPAPFTLFNNLQYEWLLVEVMPMQTAAMAAQQNIPVWTQANISTAAYQYPLSAPPLDSSKLYAWQVIAKNNISAVGKSEVWTFRRKQFDTDTSVYKKTGFYVKLKKESESYYAICDGQFHFEYLNEINDPQVSVNLYDITNANATAVFPEGLPYMVKFGQNFLSFQAGGVNGIIDRHLYLLELVNSKKEKWLVKFEYRQPLN